MKKNKPIDQERLRQIAWDIGRLYPISLADDVIVLHMVTPRLGHLHWHIRESSVEELKSRCADRFHGARLIVRLYDVTDILFDGFNAHFFFDLDIYGLAGNHYARIDRLARNYIAEAGFRLTDNSFHALARSTPTFLDRDRRSGRYQTGGLYVANAFSTVFPVENIFDAPVYEQFHRQLGELNGTSPPSVAVVLLDIRHGGGSNEELGASVREIAGHMEKFGGRAEMFSAPLPDFSNAEKNLGTLLQAPARKLLEKIEASHAKRPFSCVHCHDWYSAEAGAAAAERLDVPLVVSLHSTEHERTGGHGAMSPLSQAIREEEKKAVRKASLVICPHSSTRGQITGLYGADPGKVVIVADCLAQDKGEKELHPGDARAAFGLPLDATVALFSGEVSHAAGADILIQAMITVCRQTSSLYLGIAGDGPLRRELEHMAHNSGIGSHCRFVGDLSAESFNSILLACDFVVIPARTWQDGGLAQHALNSGRPVLVTHQAGIHCVVHGQNGLVTYDNPGSIVWGLQEMRSRPFQGNMMRVAAQLRASRQPSPETAAFHHYMHYQRISNETE